MLVFSTPEKMIHQCFTHIVKFQVGQIRITCTGLSAVRALVSGEVTGCACWQVPER